MQFVLTKPQRDLFKKSWKNFLTEKAKPLKLSIRIGASRDVMLAHHVLRHILLVDIDNIESKIVKAFKSQRTYPYSTLKPSYMGLTRAAHMFDITRKYGPKATFEKEFIDSLSDEQKLQINTIATAIAKKYQANLL